MPSFLGIGAPRCGTTWLYELLASHPDIYLPPHRKEVRFFDLYYERGLSWYEQFFPPTLKANRYQAIGEFSPNYLYCEKCPERIDNIPSIKKLILILRNPVDRAYSRYGFHVRYKNYSGSFEQFLELELYAIDEGYYRRGIENYLSRVFVTPFYYGIFEQAVGMNVQNTKKSLADFFDVPFERFPQDAGIQKVNVSYPPKRGRAIYASAMAITLRFQQWNLNLDWVVRLAKKTGIRRLFGETNKLPKMKEETNQYLKDLYREEITELETLLDLDLACWR